MARGRRSMIKASMKAVLEKAEERLQAKPDGNPLKEDLDKYHKAAKRAGVLPHEFMLQIVRGLPIDQVEHVSDLDQFVVTQVYPSLSTRVDCAKACAMYFAAKLVANNDDAASRATVVDALRDLANKLPV